MLLYEHHPCCQCSCAEHTAQHGSRYGPGGQCVTLTGGDGVPQYSDLPSNRAIDRVSGRVDGHIQLLIVQHGRLQ